MSDFSLNKPQKWSKREQLALKIFCYADFQILRLSPNRESSNLALEKKSLATPAVYAYLFMQLCEYSTNKIRINFTYQFVIIVKVKGNWVKASFLYNQHFNWNIIAFFRIPSSLVQNAIFCTHYQDENCSELAPKIVMKLTRHFMRCFCQVRFLTTKYISTKNLGLKLLYKNGTLKMWIKLASLVHFAY